MADWGSRHRDHGVWAAIESLKSALSSAPTLCDMDEQTLLEFERSRHATSVVEQRLRGVDPALLVKSSIDEIRDTAPLAVDEINAFVADSVPHHVTRLTAYIDTLLRLSPPIPIGALQHEMDVATQALRRFRALVNTQFAEVEAQLVGIEKSRTALIESLDAHASSLRDQNQRLDAVTAEFQSQFSIAQEARSAQFSADRTSLQDRIQQALEAHQESLKESKTERDTDRALTRELLARLMTEAQTEYGNKASAILEAMEDSRVKVQALVGVIGNLGVTSGYSNAAKAAKASRRLWQILTFGAIGILVAVALFVFLPALDRSSTFSWPALVGRLFVSVAIGVLAAYASKQADRFLQIEHTNQRLALELEALGPFLAPLPEEKRQAFLIRVGQRSFGRRDITFDSGKSPATMLDLFTSKEMKPLLDLLTKAIEARKQ